MDKVSLDSNILLALWRGESNAPAVSLMLDILAAQYQLVVCGAVYGELCGFYQNIDALLVAANIQVLPEMSLATWQRAGKAHTAYTLRRRNSGGGLPRQILTDYLIGAHASVNALGLFTLNTDDYIDFPEVALFTL